jgi:hypothetical protein
VDGGVQACWRACAPESIKHKALNHANHFASAPLQTGGIAPSSRSPPARMLVLVPSLSPLAALAAIGGRGISFLHSSLVVRVKFCLSWRVVGIVGAVFG